MVNWKVSKRVIKFFISISLSTISVIGLVIGNETVTGAAVGGLVAFLTSERLNDHAE